MADVQVKIGGEDVRVSVGESATEAARQVLLARAEAENAATSASAAQAYADLAFASGNIYVTRAEAVAAALPDDEWLMILGDENHGGLRTLNRMVGGVVTYQETVPGGGCYTLSLLSQLTLTSIPPDVTEVWALGRHVVGKGAAWWFETANTGETAYRKQSGDGRWWELDPDNITSLTLGCQSGDADHHPALQDGFDYLKAIGTGGHALSIVHDGYDYLMSDQLLLQDSCPDIPHTLRSNALVRMTATGANGNVVLNRNSRIHWECESGIWDAGGAQGILGNNGISASGVSSNGSNRAVNTGHGGLVRNARIDPFLRGGKVYAPQSGVIDSDFTIAGEDCDGGLALESDLSEPEELVAKSRIRAILRRCRDFGAWLLCGNGPSFRSDRDGCTIEYDFTDCGGERTLGSFVAGDVDTATDIITIEDHGCFTRDAVLLDGTGLPGGTTIGEYWTGRIDKDRVVLTAGASSCVNVPPTNISTDGSGRIGKIGHNFTTGDEILYITPTGWTEPHPDIPATQRALSVADSVTPTGLANLTRYKSVRLSHNFFGLTATSATFRNFGPTDVSLAADTIAIAGHGFATGDDVRISIGTNSNSLNDFPQLTFALQAGTANPNGAGTPVQVGTTELNDELNDQYRPQTVYYVRAIDTDTVALYRTEADALADTNRIDIVVEGYGTMGLVAAGDIITPSDQGSGYQSFVKPIDLTSTGAGTLYRGGTGVICADRGGFHTLHGTARNSGAYGPVDFLRGRLLNTCITGAWHAQIAGRMWESRNMGTRGEAVTPGSTASVNVHIDMLVTAGGREMATATGNTTAGSPIVQFIDKAYAARFEIGDKLTASAGMPSATAEYTIIDKGVGTVTLDTSAASTTATTLTLVTQWNRGVLSKANLGLISSNASLGVEPRGCTIKGTVTGYPTSVAIVYDYPTTRNSLTLDLVRPEDGQRYFGRTQDFATIGGDANKFSSSRAMQMHALPFVFGNAHLSDSGSTKTTLRTVGGRDLRIADQGGIETFEFSQTGSGPLSSSRTRPLKIGGYYFWLPAAKFRQHNAYPASDAEGGLVGLQS